MSIRGEKVILREKRIEDAPDDYAWRTDQELARLDATRPLNMSYSDFLRYSNDELDYSSPLSKRLAIETLDGKHIGNCMFYDINISKGGAELGIMIGDRDYWGKGYGTDTVESLLDYIFSSTAISRVYLHTLEWNQRALRSFAKSGFREVKKVHRSGNDFVLMEIQRSHWELRDNSDEHDAVKDIQVLHTGTEAEIGAGNTPTPSPGPISPEQTELHSQGTRVHPLRSALRPQIISGRHPQLVGGLNRTSSASARMRPLLREWLGIVCTTSSISIR